MAVTKTMNIVATTGTYMKDGQEKKRYLTVGTLFMYDDGGMSIKLDALPTNFDGSLAVYEREQRQQQWQQQYQQQQQMPQSQGSIPVEHQSIPF